MKKLTLSLFLLTLIPFNAHAAIFDTADYLDPNHHAIGVFGEALLSNPTSSGMEARYHTGISDGWNATGLIGDGSGNRGFRLGGETSYNLIPDSHNEFGLTGVAGAQYLHREAGGALQFKFAPLLNMQISALDNNPGNLYVGLPVYFEFHNSRVDTETQLTAGGIFDLSHRKDWYLVTEGGISLAKSESYILLGFGLRFGSQFILPTHEKSNHNNSSDSDREYRSEDFQK